MAEVRHLEELTVDECLDLLRRHEIGRLAIGSPHGPPFVAPVTYVLEGATIRFRSDSGEKLEAVGQLVSFQVDGVDPLHRTGWSVLAQGRLELVDEADVPSAEMDPWIGPRAFALRMVPDRVTGRHLVLRVPDVDGRGYR